MSANAERFHFSDFTTGNYRRLVHLARSRYPVRSFDDYSGTPRFVIWRHDVDFSPHGARRMARIEAEEGMRATYFWNLHSEFYNLLERDVTDCVRDVSRLGHAIGLHFDPTYDRIDTDGALIDALARERRILADVVDAPVEVFSFHNPGPETRRWSAERYAGMLNAAADVFYDSVAFCSDSNGYWRDRRLEDVLTAASDPQLQVLTHPEMWQDEPMSPRRRVRRCIDGRAQRTWEFYERLLRDNGRLNLDD